MRGRKGEVVRLQASGFFETDLRPVLLSIHGVRVGGVGRNSQAIQSVDGFKAVQTFGHEDEIRMESGNLLETWINGAADFRFFLGIGGIVAELRVADQAILQTESIDSFSKARSQGDDATNRLRNADRPSGFIGDFAVDRGRRRAKGSALRTERRRPQQQSSCCKSHRLEKLLGQAAHESPTPRKVPLSNKKAPRDTLGLTPSLFLAKSAALCGTGGWPGLRLLSRSQWRDRGRFTRPSPLPLPAN